MGNAPPGIQEQQPGKSTVKPGASTAKPSEEPAPASSNKAIDISDIDFDKLKNVNILDLYRKIPELFDQVDINKIDINNINPNIANQIKPETLQKLKEYLDK